MEINPKGTGFLRDLTSPCPCLERTKMTMCSVSPAIHIRPSSGVLWTKENLQHVISLENRHATLGKQTNSKTVSKQSCRYLHDQPRRRWMKVTPIPDTHLLSSRGSKPSSSQTQNSCVASVWAWPVWWQGARRDVLAPLSAELLSPPA